MSDASPSTPPRVELTGRRALVTGSSRGLGRATALRLAAAGCDVVVTWRKRADDAEAVADEIRSLGRTAWVHQLDMGDTASIDALFDTLSDEFGDGGLDILVANAAATSFRPLLQAEARHLERTFAITVTGFLHAVQRAVPLMQAAGGGRIVAVSGADTQVWIPAHGILGAAKAAMETMVQYLNTELGELGITIVGVNPGWIDGESLQMMLGPYYERAVKLERRTHPLRDTASPADIAESIALLCTDAARWFSGNTVLADGGGGFAFCGRYSMTAAVLPGEIVDALTGETGDDVAGGDGPPDGGAPSVPKL